MRKKRERALKQIEEKLETERAVIKAKITTLRQQCWQLLRSFACTTQQVPTTPKIVGPNNVVTCCVRLHRPLAMAGCRFARFSNFGKPWEAAKILWWSLEVLSLAKIGGIGMPSQ